MSLIAAAAVLIEDSLDEIMLAWRELEACVRNTFRDDPSVLNGPARNTFRACRKRKKDISGSGGLNTDGVNK